MGNAWHIKERRKILQEGVRVNVRKLNPVILKYLAKKTGKSESTVRQKISFLRRDNANCTLNAVAQIYARQFGISVLQKLDKEDKACLPSIEVKKNVVVIQKKPTKKEKIIEIITYSSDDYFKKGHIHEINKAYTKGCYTSVNLLARKIVENLIIDLLRAKFPPDNLANKELYYDTTKRRFKDFSVILETLYGKRNDFEMDDKNIVERLYDLAKPLKKDGNDKTHSWFYLVKIKKEIDDLELQSIIELIKKLESSLGIR